MRKISTQTLHLFIAGALLTAGAMAQTGASSKSPSTQTSSQQGSAASTQSGSTNQPSTATSSQSSAAESGQKSSASATPDIPGLPTKKDQISYAIGMNIGKGLHRDNIDVDPNMILSGLKDAMAGGKMMMTDDQAQQTLMHLQMELREQADAKRAQQSEANKKAGDAFLAANKTKPGVIALPDGLQYKIIKQGTGPKPTLNDVVTVTYRGTLINGTEFDSTAKHGGEPATFPVKGVIHGWTEALQLMPVGTKFELYLPPDLAYGEQGAGSDIGPNETLIFEVELLSAKAPEPPQQPAANKSTQPNSSTQSTTPTHQH